MLWQEERTPLHLASKMGHVSMTEFLLNKGADINAKDKVNIIKKYIKLKTWFEWVCFESSYCTIKFHKIFTFMLC